MKASLIAGSLLVAGTSADGQYYVMNRASNPNNRYLV